MNGRHSHTSKEKGIYIFYRNLYLFRERISTVLYQSSSFTLSIANLLGYQEGVKSIQQKHRKTLIYHVYLFRDISTDTYI